jgi:hypothetical protein
MAVTYGHVAQGDKDTFLARARELLDITLRILTPERAALFTAFPFREFHYLIVDINLEIENVVQSESCQCGALAETTP